MKKEIIFTILFTKLCICLLIFFSFSFLPFGKQFFYPNFRYPVHQAISLQTAFQTWDAQHYLFLSEKGYQKGQDSNAFSPLFPFAMHIFSYFTKSSFWSGIMLANLFSFFGCYLFYEYIKKIATEKVAYRSLLVLLAFPTSFYFSLIYTESLFFFLVILFFFLLQKRKLFLASLVAFFLPLTRLIGVAILFPFVTFLIFEYHKHVLTDEVIAIVLSLWSKKTFLIVAPIVGLVMVMGIFYVTTGDFFSQLNAQQNFVSHYSFFSLFNPLIFFRAFFTFPLALHGFTNSLLDRIFFLLFLSLLPLMYKRISKTLFVYAVVFGVLPTLGGSFMSYMRYLLVVFPIFITLGILSTEKKFLPFVFPYLFVSLLLQSLFLIMHSLNYWVA